MPFYAVHKGKRRGIYTDWLECKQNIFGVRHPIFKKFNTKEEAEHFLIHGFGTKTNQSMMDTLGIGEAGKTRDVTDARDNSKIDNNSEPNNSHESVQPPQPPALTPIEKIEFTRIDSENKRKQADLELQFKELQMKNQQMVLDFQSKIKELEF